ncbi:MAG: hypothetical protein NTX33_19925 [Propionibacteriales bacterium]|nr:hypothetical protein [Propionibacteriales bacterium]
MTDSTDKAMLATHGYIDRRIQSKVRPDDRLMPLPGSPTRRSDVRTGVSRTLGLPETSTQADRFERYRSHYSNLGLCDRCAALAGYGHQHGFAALVVYETRSPFTGLLIDSGTPCGTCRFVVDGFPGTEVNGWRSDGPERARYLRVSTLGYSESVGPATEVA